LIDPNKNVIPLDERLESEKDPTLRRQLEEVRFHIAVEAALDIDAALARLAPSAAYVLYDNANPPSRIEGVDAIRTNFYDGIFAMMDPSLQWFTTRLMLDDGNVITEGEQKCGIRGDFLVSQGFDADPGRFYLSEQHHMVVWPFDDAGRLIGETVFFGYQTPLDEVVKNPLEPSDMGKWSRGPVAPPGN
jgi:hypothetical protein